MKHVRWLLPGLACAALLGLSSCTSSGQSGVLADQGRKSNAAPTITAAAAPHPGRLLASNCFQCHGTDGKNGGFDSLAGDSVSELISEMNELKTGTDADEAIMKVHALGYSDAQIRLIAEYFAQVR